jgi:hypothetical protein
VKKSRKMGMTGHVGIWGRGELNTGFCGETWGKETRLDGRIILKWVFKMWDGGTWTMINGATLNLYVYLGSKDSF